MGPKSLVIIDNEKVSKQDNNFYCDNFEAKISDSFYSEFDVTLIVRESKINRARKINLNNVKIASNIFSFLFNIFRSFKKENTTYLIIAINPYTFFSYLLLFLFKKKIFVYLRSDGHEEYKAIFGYIGPIIYNIMFRVVTFKSKIISCQKRLFLKGKSKIVYPSELNSNWLENKIEPALDKPRLLYVGRIKVEKGIFSLIEIFEQIKADMALSICGRIENLNLTNKKVSFIGPKYDVNELIEVYDNHNIFILPSYTEAHPKVIDESLARGRPIIIFEDIEHIIQNRKGIFVSKRNAKSLLETVNYVMENYQTICSGMMNNNLPTKENFILEMSNILKSS